MRPDDPITLKQACSLYPGAHLTVLTLRAASDRGELLIFRLGRCCHTTQAAMEAWVKRCQDAALRRASTSTENALSGLSAMDRTSAAQDALRLTINAQKSSSLNTSRQSTSPNRQQRHS